MLGIAFYSGYILPYGFHPGHIAAFAVIMMLCAGTGNLIWATLGSLLFPLYKKYAKAINVVMGAAAGLVRVENCKDLIISAKSGSALRRSRISHRGTVRASA